MPTQIELAQAGRITTQMQHVAEVERLDAEFIRAQTAAGKIVIPANCRHRNLVPCGIGRALTTKVNANIGVSTVSGCLEAEIQKLDRAVAAGADTVMDLSTGKDVINIRRQLLDRCTCPLGTVPVYEVVSRGGIDDQVILDVIRDQARQGVDYMTIHAGLLARHVPLALRRKLGIVSRGGALIATYMKKTGRENPFYTLFDDILAICREYDVTLSLGDGLRPGCLADASDAAQFAELETLGELVRRCRAAQVQAMVEGPGHIPMDEIRMNMEKEQQLCDDAPFYILGPVVTDCAPGYDHLVGAMGGMLGAYYGAAMLCYVTPKEHLGLPNLDDVGRGVTAFKIAAHAADIARHRPEARKRDDAISDARSRFDWEAQFALALDPERARRYREEALAESGRTDHCREGKFCTMCGKEFCSVRLSQELKGQL